MQKAINLRVLTSDQQIDAASKKVEVLLGCSKKRTQVTSGMDAKTFYENMLSMAGKTLTSDGHVIDKEG